MENFLVPQKQDDGEGGGEEDGIEAVKDVAEDGRTWSLVVCRQIAEHETN